MRYQSLAILLLVLAHSALAEVVVTPGTACSAILPAQSELLEWRDVGLLNPTSDRDFFVLCPFERQSINSDNGDGSQNFWSGAIVVANTSDAETPVNISCQLKEFVGGNKVRTSGQSITLGAAGRGAVVWSSRDVSDPDLSNFNASCRLPPGTAASSIISVSTATASNEYIDRVLAAIAGD